MGGRGADGREQAAAQGAPMKDKARIYIYILVDPRDRRVRYVGQSLDPWTRRLGHHSLRLPPFKNRKDAWCMELREAGLRPRMILIGSVDERESDSAEVSAIRFYRECGCDLLNNSAHRSTFPRTRHRVRLISRRSHRVRIESYCETPSERAAINAAWPESTTARVRDVVLRAAKRRRTEGA